MGNLTSRGRKRLIDTNDINDWARPDFDALSAEDKKKFLNREAAIKLYASGKGYAEIKKETGLAQGDINRYVHRCLSGDGAGSVLGFFGIMPGCRIQSYKRIAALKTGLVADCGLSGALQKIFATYPQIEETVQGLHLNIGKSGEVKGSTPGYKAVHQTFLREYEAELVARGIDHKVCWPFNTQLHGYIAIYRYCKALEVSSDDAVRRRSGKRAAQNMAIGTGRVPLIECLRPFTYAQLDYHLVDSQSIILVENDMGCLIPINVARWYFGLIVEEHSGAILGVHAAFEKNPSADAALETVESVFQSAPFDNDDSRIRFSAEGRVLLLQFFPDLSNQTFAVLKVDNGWANTAKDFIDNVIDTVGCVVCFGTPYAWAQRDLVEQIFGKLTQSGLQRLRSTTGSGPTDPRRDAPETAAIEDQILLSDLEAIIYGVIQQHNSMKPSARNQGATPVEHIGALASPKNKSGFIYAPLPEASITDMPLMWHSQMVNIVGDPKTGKRPHFTIDGIRHTSETLSQSWRFIGQKMLVKINRRCARLVKGAIIGTGEIIDDIRVSKPWGSSNASYRHRKLVMKAAKTRQLKGWSHDPVAVALKSKSKAKQAKAALAAGKGARENDNPAYKKAHEQAQAVYGNSKSPLLYRDSVGLPATLSQGQLVGPSPLTQEVMPEVTGDPFGFLLTTTVKRRLP